MAEQRLVFAVSKKDVEEFEKLLEKEGMKPKRAVVSGQSADLAMVEVVKIIIALGGGVGIAAVIKSIALTIEKILRERKSEVRLKGRSHDLSFKNMTADEIEKILLVESKLSD